MGLLLGLLKVGWQINAAHGSVILKELLLVHGLITVVGNHSIRLLLLLHHQPLLLL